MEGKEGKEGNQQRIARAYREMHERRKRAGSVVVPQAGIEIWSGVLDALEQRGEPVEVVERIVRYVEEVAGGPDSPALMEVCEAEAYLLTRRDSADDLRYTLEQANFLLTAAFYLARAVEDERVSRFVRAANGVIVAWLEGKLL